MATLNYKAFIKADARRYFSVLLSIDKLKDRATILHVANDINATRSETQRALDMCVIQFGIKLKKTGSVYLIENWGVLNKKELESFIYSHMNVDSHELSEAQV